MKKVIFVDRDGTIIQEPSDEQVDSLEKLVFVPGAISGLKSLRALDYEIVMASNQDGLGTSAFPMEDFLPPHQFMLRTLEGEGVYFDDSLIDEHFPEDNHPNRKPGIGMFGKYLNGDYDMGASFVIGDRDSDMKLAENLGCRGLKLSEDLDWKRITEIIRSTERRVEISRKTSETDIHLILDIDGDDVSNVDTGLKFFDHMLNQIPNHGAVSLNLVCKGDLEVDEHHTMEDVGIVLGQAFAKALANKAGMERYGFVLPMDECRAMVLLDFGGRSELVWDVEFTREYVGDVPTEMFKHFFKSFADAAHCNLYIQSRGENNHHIAESVFKAFARAVKNAVRRDVFKYKLPSSKGLL